MNDKFKKGSSGKYIYDKNLGGVIKIEGTYRNPDRGLNGRIWCPTGGYFDRSIRRWFNTASEKREFMRRNNLMMEGSIDTRKKTEYMCEEINEDRRKQGLKPKTVSNLIGDSRRR